MGFCRRCGEIVSGDRCKCGGTSRDSTTKLLFAEKSSDKWSQRYLARSPSPNPSSLPPTPSQAISKDLSSPSPSTAPPARPPLSPTKLAHSFLKQAESEDAELSCVFGSVLSPKDHWQCSSCKVKFRQEEVIYPHPDAKSDPGKLAELYYCRQCFAERFSLGNCKKCKLAVLSDAKFIKHEKNLWHEPCYVCSYCPNPTQSSIVIDFAARPSCEDCFDSFAYKSAGILPSPHLSQAEWSKSPVEAPPPPNKWGRPSMSGVTNVWSSNATRSRDRNAVAKDDQGIKGKAWRVKLQRENSPLVESYEELGEKLKKVGLNVSANSHPTSSQSPSSPSKPSRFSSSSTAPPLQTLNQAGTKSDRRPSPLFVTGSRPSSPSSLSPSSPRPKLQPIQSTQPIDPSGPASRPTSPTKPSSPLKTSALAHLVTTSSTSITPLPPTNSLSSKSNKPPVEQDQENCPKCSLPLGYGQFVELSSGIIVHFDCFACDTCHKAISGKYVESEGRAYHKECAPAPKRYRTIITSLADHDDSQTTAEPSHRTAELDPNEPVCSACSKVLGYGLSVTVPKSGKSFHTSCFTCATCSKGFEKGFVEREGLAYHETCVPRSDPPPASLSSTGSRQTFPSSPSRSSRPSTLPSLPSFTRSSTSSSSTSQSTTTPRSLYATRQRPPSNLGGLLICAGCSVRATEKETVPGPGGRRYHRKCLVCGGCKRALDSECRGGETGVLRCEACRKLESRKSYQVPSQSALSQGYR